MRVGTRLPMPSRYWPGPLSDERVLYSFHMYEPYVATSAPNLTREKPYAYPGVVPFGEQQEEWNGGRVSAYLQLPLDWADKHGIERNQDRCRRVWLHAAPAGLQAVSRGCADHA